LSVESIRSDASRREPGQAYGRAAPACLRAGYGKQGVGRIGKRMAAAALKTLGRYQLERVLGKGAMGVVYEALDPRLHRKVAIKTILKSQLDDETSREYSMRFAREAQAVARLNHPNIVQVYDFGEEGDVAYIVMEFIRGKELKSFFDANENFDKADIVRIMGELLDALAFAHENGIIHRDIKPANVMIDSQGRAKLADFGVARLSDMDRTQAERTQAGTMVGTPAYMSPEQIQGQHIDGRTDIFSAGVVLYQFLTGQRPFTGAGAWTIAKKIIQEDPPLPSTINVALPKEFDLVVSKALAKQPENRYLDAREFARALKRVLEGKPAQDEDATIVGRKPAAKKPAPKAEVPKEEPAAEAPQQSQEIELEFWRAIKDSDDPDDFELYVEQFPKGTYKALAQRKIMKLKRGQSTTTRTSEDSSSRIRQAEVLKEAQAEEEKLRIEEEAEAAAAEAEDKAKREAEEKSQREAEEAAAREAKAKAKREAEDQAKRDAEVKAKRDAEEQAKREAEAKAKREAEEAAAREAEAKAKREAEEHTKREAEEAARRDAEAKARLEAEEKARLDAAAKAKREAEEHARLAAEAKARREAEEKARLEAAAKAKREAEEQARLAAEAKARREAEEKARLEAAAKAKREAEERARRGEAEAKARREAEEKARRETEAKARHDAEARARKEAEDRAREETRARARSEAAEKVGRAQAPETADAVAGRSQAAPAEKRSSMLVPGIIGALVVAGAAAYFVMKPSATPQPEVQATATPAQVEPAQPKVVPAQAKADQEAAAEAKELQAAADRAQADQEATDAKVKALQEAAKGKTQQDAAKAKAELDAAAAKAKAQQEVAAKAKAEQEAAAKARAQQEAAAKAKAEQDATAARAKAQQDAAAKAKADQDAAAAKARADQEAVAAKARADQEAAAKAKAQQEAAAKAKAQQEAAAKAKAQEAPAKAPPVQVASAQPSVSSAALYQQGLAAENGGDVKGAVKLYRRAASAGSGPAAKKLGDIFGSGKGEVGRDYQESLRWYAVARKSGEAVPEAKAR